MKRFALAMVAMVVGVVMVGGVVLAAEVVPEGDGGGGGGGSSYAGRPECGGTFLGLRPWYANLPMEGDCSITSPGEGELSSYVWGVVTNILYDLFVIVGYLAVGFIIFGGYTYLLARGDPGKIEKGKKTIISAVAGLVIAVLASLVVSFIGGNILGGL